MSRTAVGVARIRARESARPDRLFEDPYAADLAAHFGSGDDAAPSDARMALAVQVVVRTRFYDDWLLAQAARGCRQFVLLGAGLDARAYRLAWPKGTRLFELDLPPVLHAKERVLAAATPHCERTAVAVDLTEQWLPLLADAGFVPDHPTAWLAEGLLIYLEPQTAAHVLQLVTDASTAGSTLATERASPDAASRLSAADTAAATSLWLGGLAAELEPWLSARGWITQQHRLDEVAAACGRPLTRPTQSGFVTAVR